MWCRRATVLASVSSLPTSTPSRSLYDLGLCVAVTQSEFSNLMISYVQNVYGMNITRDGWMQDYAGLEVIRNLMSLNWHQIVEVLLFINCYPARSAPKILAFLLFPG